MTGAVAVNQSLDEAFSALDLPLFGTLSESDSILALEFPWTRLAKDIQFSPPSALTNDDFNNSGFELENKLAKSPLFASMTTIKRSVDALNPLSPPASISEDQGLSAKPLTSNSEALDTTSSEPSTASTTSVRRTALASPTTSIDQSGPPDIKEHRERNRVAARKCRQKAKKNTAGLQRRERQLSQQHTVLLSYVTSLREEILDLKTEILRHSNCNSSIIQNYITEAARRQMA